MLPGLVVTASVPRMRPSDFCSWQEYAVYRALEGGAENARRVPMLAADVGLADRRFQHMVDHLLFRHHVQVGTSMSPTRPGNYLIVSADDLERTVNLHTRRGLHSLAKASSLRKESLRRYLTRIQPELDLYMEELP